MTLALLAAAGFASVLQVAPVVSDTIAPAPPPPPPRALVVVDPAVPVAALSVSVPFGAAADPDGQEGAAWIAGIALDAELSRRLRRVSATHSVEVDHGFTTITVLVPAAQAGRAARAVTQALFGDPLDERALAQARTRHLQRLTFEEGAPVRLFERARLGALLGEDHPWARPVAGTAAGTAGTELADLRSRWRRAAEPGSARAVLVGAVDPRAAAAMLDPIGPVRVVGARPDSARMPDSASARDASVASEVPVEPRVADPMSRAWLRANHVVSEQEITATWVAVAVAPPRGVDRTLVELLAHHVREILSAQPPDPDLYSSTVQLLDPPGGPIVVATVAVVPERGPQWRDRIGRMLTLEARAPVDDRSFAWERRRFRNATLQARSRIDDRARLLLEEFRRDGSLRDVVSEIAGLSRLDLEAAAGGGGAVRSFLFGPAPPASGAPGGVLDPPEGESILSVNFFQEPPGSKP